MVAQTPAFKKAVEESRKLKAKPTDDELLQVSATLTQPFSDRHKPLTSNPAGNSSTASSSKARKTRPSSRPRTQACST